MNEIRRRCSWSDLGVDLFQYHDRYGHGIDLVCETPDGRVVAIEVKATATVKAGPGHATNLAWLRNRLGDPITAGSVIHRRSVAPPRPPDHPSPLDPPGGMTGAAPLAGLQPPVEQLPVREREDATVSSISKPPAKLLVVTALGP